MGLQNLLAVRPDAAIEAEIKRVAADAEAKDWGPFGGRWPQDNQTGIAELRPDHIDSARSVDYGDWQNLSVCDAGWTKDVDETIDEDAYIIITGVVDLSPSPKLREVKIDVGGTEYPAFNVSEMLAAEEPKGYFPAPITAKPKDNLKVHYRMASSVSASEELCGLLGYCLGKKAFLIKETY